MKQLKIAHFMDDGIFPISAYELFEAVAPKCNDFFIASKPHSLKFVKYIPVKFVHKLSFINPLFLKSLEQYDFVVLHSLNLFNRQLVQHSDPSRVTFVWIGMGFDYYDLIFESAESLLLDKTREIAAGARNGQPRWRWFLKQLLPLPLSSFIATKRNAIKRNAIKKIHYFSPVLENEHKLVKRKCEPPFPSYIPWNYSSNAKIIDRDCALENTVMGRNILLGNSATPTNNHIEIIDFLSHIDLYGKKIICPLSYGNQKYADFIIKYADNKLGEGFVPIRDFLPLEDYTSLISNCSIVIMNHVRQQGVGNADAMLAKGAKVFLREENPLFQLYKSKGIKVFKIQDLEADPSLLFEDMAKKALENNKKILKQFRGMEIKITMTKNLIEQCCASKSRIR